MLPSLDIRDKADRAWTRRLVARLSEAELPDEEIDDLIDTLQTLSDVRSIDPLEALVLDPSYREAVRDAASDVLHGFRHIVYEPDPAQVRRWWNEGDVVLRQHALVAMNASCCADLVLRTASDPTHDLHPIALRRMAFGFERPEQQAVKIAGLSHPDPQVRTAAAEVLVWDEPVAAEGPLLAATHDPDPVVVRESANTLKYFHSRRVLRRLHELTLHEDERVRAEAEESFEDMQGGFLYALHPRHGTAAEHIRDWLSPVWDILAFTEEELQFPDDPPYERKEPARVTPPADDLLALLVNPDASPLVLYQYDTDWASYSQQDRERLRLVLMTHGDPEVRCMAARAHHAWQDVAGLLALASDTSFGVRKSAVYHLGELPQSPDLAEWALHLLDRVNPAGWNAWETLRVFTHHAARERAVPVLTSIASDPGRSEGLRSAAVNDLATLDATEEVRALLRLLREPPPVTWSLHIAVLNAASDLRLPLPDVAHLWEVDDLDLQSALARAIV